MSETRRATPALAILSALVLAGVLLVSGGADRAEEVRVGAGRPTAEGPARTWRSSIRPEQGSGQSGAAVLTVVGQGSTRIEVTLSGDTSRPLPAHLHVGSCGSPDPRPRYALTSVQRGRSETVVPVDLQDLLSRKFSIRIQSTRRSATVACGELVGG